MTDVKSPDDLIARLNLFLDTVPIQHQRWMSQHARLVREAAEALAALQQSEDFQRKRADKWVKAFQDHVEEWEKMGKERDAAVAALRVSAQPAEIPCPACGDIVEQVASATLGLALWQHWNWTCPKGSAPVAPEEPKDWQPIETAPKDGSEVLLWWPHWCQRPTIGYWKHGIWVAENALEGDYEPPLHWMPLPAPPARVPAAQPEEAHEDGCPARGGYGHGVEECICKLSAALPAARAQEEP